MGCARLYTALVMVFSVTLVESFTFPGDWHKIRQIMEGRMKKDEVELKILFITHSLTVHEFK